MGIIEKLGITPIEVRSQHNHNDFKWFYELEIKEVRYLEQQRDDLLEVLIADIVRAEISWVENWQESFENDPNKTDDEIRSECHKANNNKISIIEKTSDKTWEEIKTLIKEG